MSLLEPSSFPIIINNYNRLTFLMKQIDWFKSAGLKNINIIDNASLYPPLLEYYKTLPYPIFYLRQNTGYLALWESGIIDLFKHSYFAYTDSDVVPIDECPKNILHYFYAILQARNEIDKIGIGLKIDDIPDHCQAKNEIIMHETQFWLKKASSQLYDAQVDTTFALYRPFAQGGYWIKAYRTGYPYIARHLPWYTDSKNPSDEDLFYVKSVTESTHWTSKVLNLSE